MSGELFPIASGLIVGLIAGYVALRLRVWASISLAVLFGVLATVLSGEFAISWLFLLIDIPLVAVAAASAFMLMRRARLGNWMLH